MRRIGVIGGGASGITAAIAAAKTNKDSKIFILEHNRNIGRKILATGNGRCNLTNQYMDVSCYHGENPDMVNQVLRQFGTKETLEFFHSLGLLTKLRGDYVYPRSDQASTVVKLLEMELNRLGVEICTESHVLSLHQAKNGFSICTGERTYRADRVILACGGRASSTLGSDGSGYTLAKSMGHRIVPVVPALVQLHVRNHPFCKAAGVRTEGRVTALIDGHALAHDAGELQITAYGISGIPIFQISRHIARGIYDKKEVKIMVDFFPEISEDGLKKRLSERAKRREDWTIEAYFVGVFPEKFIPALLNQAGIRAKTRVRELAKKQWDSLTEKCKRNLLSIEDTNGFDNAQVCAGGVRTSEVSPFTMESKCVDGLYLSGEILDVDGICGGYNLQWAWATGYIAGKHAAE